MSSPHSIHHQFLRPSVLHILRAAGFHSTKPSTLDALTDIAGRYMSLLAASTANHAVANHEDDVEIRIEDVRMSMQECGVLGPERILEDQGFGDEEQEDMRGVEAFLEWAMGRANKEIRRIAVESMEDGAEDFLTVLMKKHDKTEDSSRYHNTVLGPPAAPHSVTIEGSEITTIEDWSSRLRAKATQRLDAAPSRRESSDLSSVGDQSMAEPDSD